MDLDAQTVFDVGGWDARYAVVRAVRTLGERSAAVIDSNGDDADINLEHFRWSAGHWQLCSSSGGAGNRGRSWYDGFWAEHDRTEDGWWLTLKPGPEPSNDQAIVESDQSYGWWAYAPRR